MFSYMYITPRQARHTLHCPFLVKTLRKYCIVTSLLIRFQKRENSKKISKYKIGPLEGCLSLQPSSVVEIALEKDFDQKLSYKSNLALGFSEKKSQNGIHALSVCMQQIIKSAQANTLVSFRSAMSVGPTVISAFPFIFTCLLT